MHNELIILTKVVVLKEVKFIIDISNGNTFIICPAWTPVKIQTTNMQRTCLAVTGRTRIKLTVIINIVMNSNSLSPSCNLLLIERFNAGTCLQVPKLQVCLSLRVILRF